MHTIKIPSDEWAYTTPNLPFSSQVQQTEIVYVTYTYMSMSFKIIKSEDSFHYTPLVDDSFQHKLKIDIFQHTDGYSYII